MDTEIEMLHKRLLEMAIEFHKACSDLGVRYYLMYGTALGAGRHKGFIPWDDDMDVGVPREDYQRLREELPQRLPEYLQLWDYRTHTDMPMHFIKLIDSRTTVIESSFQKNIEGIYIDIFPIDGALMPTSLIEMIRRRKIWYHTAVCSYHYTTEKKDRHYKRVLKKWASAQNMIHTHEKIEKLLTFFPYQDMEYCCSYLGGYGIKEAIPKEILGRPTLYEFEGIQLYGPERLDEYLRCLYGEYMQLPPPEDRMPRHNYSILDFNTPYRVYSETHKK